MPLKQCGAARAMRAVHVGFLLALGYPLLALGRGFGTPLRALCWLFAAAGVAVAAYQWIEYTPLLFRAGDPNLPDLVFGCVAVVTVFVAAWLLMGPALPIICGLFLAYALFGQHLPRSAAQVATRLSTPAPARSARTCWQPLPFSPAHRRFLPQLWPPHLRMEERPGRLQVAGSRL